ncbi:MinD/ParA family ATP-binding protein [Massilia soli]|uniref:Antiactivator of flagellar biosynthesis FleN protein n=1 Tax=Massilia soli TaxID=2792854 RepID=A0ABS7SSZ2_9BURK|nr:antiactivator of flagellar biosynthesis FleN protein [Massilia soli]MBZ2209056.1 antiactivator of flagellar biosynthesis FleN protein [Massilia soli]
MANFDFDQAEGLRRMLAGPKPRIVTFLSATEQDDKGAMLVNLGASLAHAGSDVLLVDACERGYGVTRRLGIDSEHSLLSVARQECALNQVIHQAPQGFGVVTMLHGVRYDANDARRVAKTFDVLVKQSGIVMVDGELASDDSFPLPVMAESEIVVQVSTSAESITNAYSLIKRLSQQYGRRPFGILVTNASETEAKVVYDNMATAASRYLAVQLTSMGSVPADEHLHRAARLGRSVVDAFPLAGASVAFRRLAGRFALPGMPQLGRTGGNIQLGA